MVVTSLCVCFQVQSIRLIPSEKVKLVKSVVFLGITSFKLSIYMLIDYCLYWVLSTVKHHGRLRTTVEGWFA
jgi:hypothetical protein